MSESFTDSSSYASYARFSEAVAWFAPTDEERSIYGAYSLEDPHLLIKPDNVLDDHIAYNPSAIWTVTAKDGKTRDIMYVRVEPNRSSSKTSHLGNAAVRPYIVDVQNPTAALEPYYEAEEFRGEDAALTRVNRKLACGKIEKIWLLSCVDPVPSPDKANEVLTLHTRFYAGSNLKELEHIADGPEWMKDIRVASADGPEGTELDVYGRPQTQPDSGNITYIKLASLKELTPDNIAAASYIHDGLLKIGSGVWGGVNDVISVAPGRNILAGHRARRTGVSGHGRHYESVLYGHDTQADRIVELGVIAAAGMFPRGTVKDDTSVDLSDVVFTGGGYNGTLEYMTFGVRDGALGLAGLRRSGRKPGYPVVCD